jgi:hypothetical protein
MYAQWSLATSNQIFSLTWCEQGRLPLAHVVPALPGRFRRVQVRHGFTPSLHPPLSYEVETGYEVVLKYIYIYIYIYIFIYIYTYIHIYVKAGYEVVLNVVGCRSAPDDLYQSDFGGCIFFDGRNLLRHPQITPFEQSSDLSRNLTCNRGDFSRR